MNKKPCPKCEARRVAHRNHMREVRKKKVVVSPGGGSFRVPKDLKRPSAKGSGKRSKRPGQSKRQLGLSLAQ